MNRCIDSAILWALVLLGQACQQEAPPPPTVASGGVLTSGAGASSGAPLTDASTGPVLASGLFSPQAIVLDSTNVYWTTANGVSAGTRGDASAAPGSVETVARAGGSVVDLISGLSAPQQLAIYSSTLFFAQGVAGARQLDAYTLGTTFVAEVATATASSLPMFVNDSTLYWSSTSGTHVMLQSASTSGGKVSSLFDVAASYAPLAIAVSGSTVFLLASTSGTGYVLSAPTSGGAPTELWHQAGVSPVALAASGDSVYWSLTSSSNGGEVLSTGSSGGEVFTLASNIENVGGVAATSGTVYFTSDVAAGLVLSVSSAGGTVSTLATGLDYPAPLAVDDAVYVGTASTIVRVPL